MPKTTTYLNEDDIKTAIRYWLESGHPAPRLGNERKVRIHVERKIGNDPREPDQVITAEADE